MAHERYHKKDNFLRQFRDEQSKEIQQLTATQFMDIWSHYDIDGKKKQSYFSIKDFRLIQFEGNGYIEGCELDDLLRELVASVNTQETCPEVSANTNNNKKMEKIDK